VAKNTLVSRGDFLFSGAENISPKLCPGKPVPSAYISRDAKTELALGFWLLAL
jgi:hypothetical protein